MYRDSELGGIMVCLRDWNKAILSLFYFFRVGMDSDMRLRFVSKVGLYYTGNWLNDIRNFEFFFLGIARSHFRILSMEEMHGRDLENHS